MTTSTEKSEAGGPRFALNHWLLSFDPWIDEVQRLAVHKIP